MLNRPGHYGKRRGVGVVMRSSDVSLITVTSNTGSSHSGELLSKNSNFFFILKNKTVYMSLSLSYIISGQCVNML